LRAEAPPPATTLGVPPADPDGTGFASITLNVGQARVCWEISVSNIAPAFGAHIHVAPAGVNGPSVVPLIPPTSGCGENVDPGLLQASSTIRSSTT